MQEPVSELADRCPTCNRPYRQEHPREAVVRAAEAVVAQAMAEILQEGDDGTSGVLEPV